MAFTFSDIFFVLDPVNPPPPGTFLTAQTFSVADNNEDGEIDRTAHDTIDGANITAVYTPDTITITDVNGVQITYTGATFYLEDGRQVFTPTDGQDLVDGALVSAVGTNPGKGNKSHISIPIPDFGPPCFTPGVLIDTIRGKVPVEQIGTGDRVLTADHGAVEVLATRRMTLSAKDLAAAPRRIPVRIAQDALGVGLPARDLTVSPQHRMVLSGPLVDRMFETPEIMVPACQLVGLPGIERQPSPEGVTYIHLLCARHQVIFAEDAPTESLYLGEQVHENLSPRDIDVLRAKLPGRWQETMQPARLFVRGAKLRSFVERAQKNGRPLFEVPAATERQLARVG